MSSPPSRRREEKKIPSSLIARIALPLALIALIPSVVGIVMLDREISQNRHNIQQITELRRASNASARSARASARAADIKICKALNKITRRDRATIKAGPAQAADLLRALGFTEKAIATYREKAQALVDRELKRRPLLGADGTHPEGNCRTLPNPARSAASASGS